MKHRNHHHRAAGFVTLSGLVLGLVLNHQYEPSEALAADDKVFAPQFCVPLEKGYKFEGEAEYRVDSVRQTEEENGYQTFICPLIRDVVADSSLEAVWVRVKNAQPKDEDPPKCCIHSVSLGTSMTDFQCKTAKNDEKQQSLEINTEKLEIHDHGFYVVTCELGEDDEILGIRTSEEQNEDN